LEAIDIKEKKIKTGKEDTYMSLYKTTKHIGILLMNPPM
jgi:hypothetical protein